MYLYSCWFKNNSKTSPGDLEWAPGERAGKISGIWLGHFQLLPQVLPKFFLSSCCLCSLEMSTLFLFSSAPLPFLLSLTFWPEWGKSWNIAIAGSMQLFQSQPAEWPFAQVSLLYLHFCHLVNPLHQLQVSKSEGNRNNCIALALLSGILSTHSPFAWAHSQRIVKPRRIPQLSFLALEKYREL